MQYNIGITTSLACFQETVDRLAQQYGLIPCQNMREHLFVFDCRLDGLYVQWNKKPVMYFHLDYLRGRSAYRRKNSGKKHLLSKALGLHKVAEPTVIDCTAGWGEDSLLMASWGCHVTMLERCAPVVCLLDDALGRLPSDVVVGSITLTHVDALEYLSSDVVHADIVYLDPMFEDIQQKAKVKKPMQLLRAWLSDQTEKSDDIFTCGQSLLELALGSAKKRVVVKRHLHAPALDQKQPNYSCCGKSTRYDVYLT